MDAAERIADRSVVGGRLLGRFELGTLLVALGFLAVAIPTFIAMGAEYWTVEAGSHSPIVLMTGIWLILHVRPQLAATAGPPLRTWLVMVACALFVVGYVLGDTLDLLFIEASALYGFFLLIAARFIGVSGLARNAFPFLYPAFLIPVPGWLLDMLTGTLREWISEVAAMILGGVGLPVSQQGVVINIAQYQLLVEDACSGVNSLIGLTAISLFYIYILHRANWKHVLILFLAILPVAILANLIRVIILILLTYYFGDAVAQGFSHNVAGILLFAIALAMMVGLDVLIRKSGLARPSPSSEGQS